MWTRKSPGFGHHVQGVMIGQPVASMPSYSSLVRNRLQRVTLAKFACKDAHGNVGHQKVQTDEPERTAYHDDHPDTAYEEKESDEDNFTSERFSQVWDLISQEVSK